MTTRIAIIPILVAALLGAIVAVVLVARSDCPAALDRPQALPWLQDMQAQVCPETAP